MNRRIAEMREDDRKDYSRTAPGFRGTAYRHKREFLRRLAVAGVGLSSFAATMLGGNRPFSGVASALAQTDSGPSARWENGSEVGGKYKGTRIRYRLRVDATHRGRQVVAKG
jgi:hypothetical protein